MPETKKYLLRFGAFFITLLVLLEGVILFARTLEYWIYHNRDYAWVDTVKPEVLLMGSSTIYSGVSPTVFDLSRQRPPGNSVNLGYSARTAVQSYYVWNSLEPSTRAGVKLVLYGFDPWVFYEKYYVNDPFGPVRWDLPERAYAAVRLNRPRDLVTYSFLGDLLFRGIEAWLDEKVGTPLIETRAIPPDFGAIVSGIHPVNFDGLDRGISFDPVSLFPVSRWNFDALKKLKEETIANGARFVLVLPPKTLEWEQQYRTHCSDLDEELVKHLNEDLGHTPVVGSFHLFAENSGDAYMNDCCHMKRQGQVAFSQYLAQQVSQISSAPMTSISQIHALYRY